VLEAFNPPVVKLMTKIGVILSFLL